MKPRRIQRRQVFFRLAHTWNDRPDHLKVTFGYDDWESGDYFVISHKKLMKAGDAVRLALDGLVESALRSSKNGEIPFDDVQALDELLRKLVEAGKSLYLAFFTPEPIDFGENPERAARNAREAEEWFRTEVDRPRKDAVRVHIRVPVNVTVPFGLIYTSNLNSHLATSARVAFDDLQDFWCIKFSAFTTYAWSKPYFNNRPLSHSKTKLLPVFHEQERVRAESMTGLPWVSSVPVSTSPDEFANALQATNGFTRILYFYCHASGSTLSLSNAAEYDLTAVRFREGVYAESRGGDNLRVYTILNGCSTATSNGVQVAEIDGGASWLHVTATEPLRGFVGTETKVPSLFAWRFGLALLREILRGVPLDEALLELRRAHWPLSLLYGLYCYPELQLRSGMPEFFPDFPDGNFSKLPVGADSI